MSARHGELIVDVIRHATRLLAEGDESALTALGFTPEQIRCLEALTLKSVHRLGQLSAHFLDFRLDPACFIRVMRRVEQENEDQALQDALLRAGAPIRMMHHFWGMTSRDCAERRRVLDIEPPIGRPAHADDPDLEHLWHLWQATDDIPDERRRYLVLAERSQLPLSAIWTVVEDWKGTAGPDAARDPAPTRPPSDNGSVPGSRVVELHR
jgi:Protein of unknown function (DUF2857)